jgi:hypothetical protein
MNEPVVHDAVSGAGHGDRFLARVLRSRSYRWTIYGFLFLNATASLYYRVGMGGSVQVLPWYASVLSLFFLGMAVKSVNGRARVAHTSFSILVVAAFTRDLLRPYARVVGLVEVAACLLVLAALMSLARDARFLRAGAVLESDKQTTQEDPGSENKRTHD